MNDPAEFWKYKAKCLIEFAIKSHNATWKTDSPSMQLGRMVGVALMVSFSIECALKALLEENGVPITRNLWKHNLHMLFSKLPPIARTKASSVYKSIIQMEQNSRVRNTPADSLESCLEAHDNAFYDWRYRTGYGKFYPGPMMYACISLLTILFPNDEFTTGSGTSPAIKVKGGKISGYQV